MNTYRYRNAHITYLYKLTMALSIRLTSAGLVERWIRTEDI